MMILYKIIIRWALNDSQGQREQTNKQSTFVQLYQERLLQGIRNKYQCFAKTHLIFTERFLKRRWEGYRDTSGGGGGGRRHLSCRDKLYPPTSGAR